MENVFLYIDKWDFYDNFEKDNFFGHPKTGKVYKAIKRSKFYDIPLDSKNGATGVRLDLGEVYDGAGKWNYKIKEITEENLVGLDLSVEDLEKIETNWSKEDIQEDLMTSNDSPSSDDNEYDYEYEEEEISGEKGLAEFFKPLQENIKSIIKTRRAFKDMSIGLNVIVDNDPEMLFLLADIITDIARGYDEEKDFRKEIILNIFKLKNERNGNHN